VDRQTQNLARLASNGDSEAGLKLHRLLIDRACTDGGLSHELAEPRRLTFTDDDGNEQTLERVSTCKRCRAEVPYQWVMTRDPFARARAAINAPSLQDFLQRDDEGNFIAHIRTSPLEP
jgi:hypothetical protein